MSTIIVTGAAGFIGSAVCRYLRANKIASVIGVDKMTYAATKESLADLKDDPDFILAEIDICDGAKIFEILMQIKPTGIMHLAAETHVDRSIDSPGDFLQANIIGTYCLLEMARQYQKTLLDEQQKLFRFLHVSTDEVYGSLGDSGSFTEETPYAPNSPYAASKASADHLVRAWHKTFDLPVVISNCSNNYGPFQFPEKLIPLMIMKALSGQKLPVYGKGLNVRDWLYVEDHAEALYQIFSRGRLGEKYNVGGAAEYRNIDLVNELCALLDETSENAAKQSYKNQITYVTDRPGHDERYAMNFSKLNKELGWSPKMTLPRGLRKTVNWYLENRAWCEAIQKRNYSGERLGQLKAAGKN